MSKTPELDKMTAVREKSQVLGDFIEWLTETKKLELAYWHAHGPDCEGWDPDREEIVHTYGPCSCGGSSHSFCNRKIVGGCEMPTKAMISYRYNIEGLLAEFFEIDMKKVEEERRAILDGLRGSR